MVTGKEIREAIAKAVETRESGDYQKGLDQLRLWQDKVKQVGNLHLEDIIAEVIVCLKHKYEYTRHPMALNEIKSEINAGLSLLIPQPCKAVFHLRLGDFYTYQGDKVSALNSYQKAYDLVIVINAELHTTGEYLGHLAESLSVNGHNKKALSNFYQAINLVEQDAKIEEWYRLIILSGIRGRMIIPAIKSLKIHVALWSFFVSYRMALKLKKFYNKPVRLDQYHRRIKKILRIK